MKRQIEDVRKLTKDPGQSSKHPKTVASDSFGSDGAKKYVVDAKRTHESRFRSWEDVVSAWLGHQKHPYPIICTLHHPV